MPDEPNAARFEATFNAAPAVAASAPGRVNLIGEHTDYNDGFVLPMAIDRRTFVLARPRDDRRLRFWAADLPGEPLDEIDPGKDPRPDRGSFASYVLGVIGQMRAAGAEVPGIDLMASGDVPIGAGLASSAALTVATATALESLTGNPLQSLDKARLCRRAESESAGTPCGIMDMLVAVAAQEGRALLIDCRDLAVSPVALPEADRCRILVADTGVRHALADGAYARCREECETAARALGLASLRDATEAMLDGATMPAPIRDRARHVIRENARTLDAARALADGDLARAGDLLWSGHRSLRDLYRVSCPELDELVEAAMELRGAGVFGARMTGAGFGGCVIVLARPDPAGRLEAHLTGRFTRCFGRPPVLFEVRPGRPCAVHAAASLDDRT